MATQQPSLFGADEFEALGSLLLPEKSDPRTSPHVLVASVSGGRDSTALILHLSDHGVVFEGLHMDTGWEAQETVDYIHGPLSDLVLAHTGRPLRIVQRDFRLTPDQEAAAERVEAVLGQGKSGMVRLTLKKGMFPARTIRFCTQELKIFPARDYYRSLTAEDESVIPVNAQGIRANESIARSKYPVWDPYDGDCAIWRPLLRWTGEDVAEIHRRHGIEMNPLYAAGASRVGCWPCIFARKSEIANIADTDPRRIKAMRLLEAEVGHAAALRAEAKGKAVDNPPGFFQSLYSTRKPGEKHEGTCWPIDKAVAWSRTKTRKDLEHFADGVQEGCGRLSACELPVYEPPVRTLDMLFDDLEEA